MPPRAFSLRIHSKGLTPVYVSMPSLSSRRDCSQTSKCWYGSNPDLDWMAVFSKLYSNARWMAGQRRRDSSFLLPHQQHDFPAKYRPVGRLCYRIVIRLVDKLHDLAVAVSSRHGLTAEAKNALHALLPTTLVHAGPVVGDLPNLTVASLPIILMCNRVAVPCLASMRAVFSKLNSEVRRIASQHLRGWSLFFAYE